MTGMEPLLATLGLAEGPWMPILHGWPWPMANFVRLVLFFPLVACVAVVYRATRVRYADAVAVGALRIFLTITLGMWGLAVGLYLIYELVLRTFYR